MKISTVEKYGALFIKVIIIVNHLYKLLIVIWQLRCDSFCSIHSNWRQFWCIFFLFQLFCNSNFVHCNSTFQEENWGFFSSSSECLCFFGIWETFLLLFSFQIRFFSLLPQSFWFKYWIGDVFGGFNRVCVFFFTVNGFFLPKLS